MEEQWDNLFYIKLSVYVREKKKSEEQEPVPEGEIKQILEENTGV